LNKFIRDLRRVPVIRILFPYIIGILLEKIFQLRFFPDVLFIASLLLFVLAFGLRRIKGRKSFQSGRMFSLAYFILFVGFGILNLRATISSPPNLEHGDSCFVTGFLTSDPREKEKVYSVTMETERIRIHDSLITGKQNLVLYFKKDSLFPVMLAGEKWVFGGTLQEIKNNGNPGEFDFADYMHRRNYWSTMFVEDRVHAKLPGTSGNQIKYLPHRISRKIRQGWSTDDPDLAILCAITLGDKSMLSQDTRKAFSGSGAMHLLAVSGLHVGMIWWILDLLIAFPKRKRLFRVLKVLTILGILWIYAGITGFSDSVTRSVTMFSLVSVARAISRNSNIFNTLFLSAFLLLILKPVRLFEPGFQLSYLAVFGIVIIHPLLAGIFKVENKLLKRITDLIFVSIAAQLSTLPLSLLFFNLFPVYFILTNLFAIPIVSILLGLFVLFTPMFLLNFHPEFFYMILLKITHLLNEGIGLISSLPGSVVENIPMNSVTAVLLIVLLFSATAFVVYKRINWALISFSALVLVILFSAFIRMPAQDGNGISVYNFKDCTAISFCQRGKQNTYLIYNDEKPSSFVYEYLNSPKVIRLQSAEYQLFEIATDVSYSVDFEGLTWLCHGAWGISEGGLRILVCGSCEKSDFGEILHGIDWDIIVFRRGIPFLKKEVFEADEHPVYIADGTLRNYELTRLRDILPGLYCTATEGAWLYDFSE